MLGSNRMIGPRIAVLTLPSMVATPVYATRLLMAGIKPPSVAAEERKIQAHDASLATPWNGFAIFSRLIAGVPLKSEFASPGTAVEGELAAPEHILQSDRPPRSGRKEGQSDEVSQQEQRSASERSRSHHAIWTTSPKHWG